MVKSYEIPSLQGKTRPGSFETESIAPKIIPGTEVTPQSTVSNSISSNNEHSTKTRRRSSLLPKAKINIGALPTINDPILESFPKTAFYEGQNQQTQHDFILNSSTKNYNSPRFTNTHEPLTPGIETLPSSPTAAANVYSRRPHLQKNITSSTITKLLGEPEDIDENVLSIMNPPRNLYRVICACCWTFILGMSDGCLGALLPSIEKYYGISYALVSLIWLGNAIGFIIIAFTAHLLENKFGKHVMLSVSACCFTVCYSLVSSGLPFAGIIIAFFFAGLGGAIGLSQYNIFMSKLLNGSKYLGFFHGTYGIGATVSPLIGTAMLNRGVIWHFFFLIPLTVSVGNVIFTFLAFKGCDEDLKRWDHVDNNDEENDPIVIEMDYFGQEAEIRKQKSDYIEENTVNLGNSSTTMDTTNKLNEDNEECSHDFKAALMDYRTWLVCLFIFFYQGTEVSMGGWVVTFLIEYRDGSESSTGYVSSGFWGGVAVGRLLLTHNLCRWFKVRRTIIVISAFIIGLDILAWLVPSAIASAVFSCGIGLCIGPIYPMMITLVTKILPRKIRFCAMTLGTAFGSSGGSAVPFAIGIASQFTGTWILHPIFLGCYFAMVVSWIAMPNLERNGAITNLWQRLW